MGRKHVVILTGQSLLAEGIANRLRDYLQCVDLEIVNRREPDAMARVIDLRPSIVILDVTDSGVTQSCALSDLLLALPHLGVICLNPQQEQVQVVTSQQHPAAEVRDLADVIDLYVRNPPDDRVSCL